MMTTETPDNVPKYFADFRAENAREHGELGQRIVESENRIIRTQNNLLLKLMGGVVGSILVIVGAATAYIVQTLGGSS